MRTQVPQLRSEPWALRNALAVLVAGGAVAILVFILSYGATDGDDKDRFDVGIKAATATAAIVAGVLTWGRLELSRGEHRLGVDRDLTERYGRAVEQLGDDKAIIRVGGIFAMERFALDAIALSGTGRDTDWRMALDLLADFAREHSGYLGHPPATGQPTTSLEGLAASDDSPGDLRVSDTPGPVDVVAAVRVLGRFGRRAGLPIRVLAGLNVWYELSGIQVAGADLSRAYLRGRLANADLSGADLVGATLFDADLVGATLIRAKLRHANLRGADLRGADLRGADLRHAELGDGANLRDADLGGADLDGANLRGASLRGANLHGATLTDTDIRDADLSDADLRGAELSSLTSATVPTSAAPTSAAPTPPAPASATPASAAPSSAAPTCTVPSSATRTFATPTCAAPISAMPTSAAPTSATPSSTASSITMRRGGPTGSIRRRLGHRNPRFSASGNARRGRGCAVLAGLHVPVGHRADRVGRGRAGLVVGVRGRRGGRGRLRRGRCLFILCRKHVCHERRRSPDEARHNPVQPKQQRRQHFRWVRLP
jgi:Pentapeptide repeats (8 copies)